MVLHVEGRLNVAADALSRDNLSLFCYHVPDAHPSPTQGAGGVAGNSAARLDLQKLEETVQFYFTKGLTQSTLRTYRSGKERYLKFCSQAILNPLPVSEQVLCSFVSHLAQQGLKHRTIKVYLSAVRHLQIAGNYPDPFGGSPMPKLEYVLRGVKKYEAEKGEGQRPRLPITPEILCRLKSPWEPTAHIWDTRMVRLMGRVLPGVFRVPPSRGVYCAGQRQLLPKRAFELREYRPRRPQKSDCAPGLHQTVED